ncbi:urease subunit alpha, partial [Streptomyces sp. NPDC000410]
MSRPTRHSDHCSPGASRHIDPHEYASVHGPRAGDRVVLGDSGLVVRVESDSQKPGDEFL